jgi:hypothetical protein
MNWAKPCLACFDDGGAEIVIDGETGLLVHQPRSLARPAGGDYSNITPPRCTRSGSRRNLLLCWRDRIGRSIYNLTRSVRLARGRGTTSSAGAVRSQVPRDLRW